MLLFGKDTLSLVDIMTVFVSNEIRKMQNLERYQDFGLVNRVKNYKKKVIYEGIWE